MNFLKTGSLLLCILFQPAAGQTPARILDFNRHVWASYSGDHPVSGKWGLHFDAQWRRADLGTEWQQYQLRPGLNYEFSRRALFTIGYAFTKAYEYGDFPVRTSFPEHRVYQQLLLRHGARDRVRFQHRTRMEQRWIKYPDPQPRSWTYQNRFRYMLRAEIPISDGATETGRWYVPIFNEILIGIPPNYGARPFDQNRLFGGIGRNVGPANIEVGYMKQFIGQRNGRIFEFNNTFFVTITSNVPLF
jgi:hypothetical protein